MAVASSRGPTASRQARVRTSAGSNTAASGPARVPRQRRVRRAIRHLEVMSVLKVSLVLYMSVLLVSLIAGGVLWGALSAVGVIHRVEHFIDDLFGFKSFAVAGLQLLLVAVLVGLVLVILGALFNVLCAVLYNITCDVVGGIQVIEVEDVSGGVPERLPPPPDYVSRSR